MIKTHVVNIQEYQGIGLDSNISLLVMVAYCNGALDSLVLQQICVAGFMSIGGTINRAEELASMLRDVFDAGAKRMLIPMSSAADIPMIPTELFAKFQILFYRRPEDAVNREADGRY